MKNVKLILLLGFVASLGWVSCKKGDTGPAGATGPAGPDSVVYSAWQTLTLSYVATSDSSGYGADTVLAPSVTQGILDSGVVLGYIDITSGQDHSTIIPMSTATNYGFEEYVSLGMIEIDDLSGFDRSGIGYRYVTIPGSKMEGNSTQRKYNGHTIEELKGMTYDKVKAVAAGN